MASDIYTVTGVNPVCGVEPGGSLTEDVLADHAADTEFLVSIGAIRKQRPASATVEPSKTSKRSTSKKKELSDG